MGTDVSICTRFAIRVMDGLGPDANGGFYAWDGAPIPW
jgi:hypothetical protein